MCCFSFSVNMASQDNSLRTTASKQPTAEVPGGRQYIRRSTLCMRCYPKWDQMAGYTSKYCKEKPAGTEAARIFREAIDNMAGSLFFSGTELTKDTYSRYEVMEILRSFGHCAVPEKFDKVYKRQPVDDNLTGRYFKTEMEEYNQLQQWK